MPFSLSERQQTAVSAAVTILAAVVILAAVAALLWLLGTFVQRFSNVLLPLAVAGVAALVFNPWFEWLRDRAKLPPILAVAVVFLSILLPIVGFLWIFGALIVHQVTDLIAGFPEWWSGQLASIKERVPRVAQFFNENPWGQRIRAALEGQEGSLMHGVQVFGDKALSAGGILLRGVGAALGWAVLPVYFAFFLMAEADNLGKLENHLPFLKAETRRDLVYLVREFVSIIVAFFRGQLIVAFLQGLLFAIGFSLIGLKYGFVLGLALGFLNIIPYLGSIVGLGVALPLALFQNGGGWVLVALVIAVFTAVQMIEGYVLTPKVMGDRTGLHPMVIIVAVFFWGSALGGIMGMILAIPLTAFLVVFWRLLREKYIQELV
ncbi:MAG: AI-2E family transporter [Acidobacteriota bacterium]